MLPDMSMGRRRESKLMFLPSGNCEPSVTKLNPEQTEEKIN